MLIPNLLIEGQPSVRINELLLVTGVKKVTGSGLTVLVSLRFYMHLGNKRMHFLPQLKLAQRTFFIGSFLYVQICYSLYS